jgi:phosphatidylglycerophosphatase A
MGIRNKALLFVTTCGFVGYLPLAPGTYASALGGVLLYLFPFTSLLNSVLVVAGLIVLSIVCINLLPLEQEDPGFIVVDELAGMYVALAGHKPTVFNIVLGFVLFRIFDIVKPFPVNRAEGLTKGYGIVADDVVAGLYANCVLVVVGLTVRLW